MPVQHRVPQMPGSARERREELERASSMAKALCRNDGVNPDDWARREDCPEWELRLGEGLAIVRHFDRFEAERRQRAEAIAAAVV